MKKTLALVFEIVSLRLFFFFCFFGGGGMTVYAAVAYFKGGDVKAYCVKRDRCVL